MRRVLSNMLNQICQRATNSVIETKGNWMIVWLASYPRSGNNFFRVTSQLLFGVKSFSIYPGKGPQLNKEELCFADTSEKPILVKTHELPCDSNQTIYLVRDGRDSIVSYAHWTLFRETGAESIDPKSNPFQERLRAIITSNKYFSDWCTHILAWHRRRNTHIVRFEDLIVEPKSVVSQALELASIPHISKENTSPIEFKALHARDPILYRKGKVGNWKSNMTPEIQELFWQQCGSAMKLLGYT